MLLQSHGLDRDSDTGGSNTAGRGLQNHWMSRVLLPGASVVSTVSISIS